MINMEDFASFIEKQTRTILKNTFFDDHMHRELVPLSHLKERHSSWTLEMDLPLVEKKNIEITLSGEYLTIRAKLTKTFCISKGSTVTEFDYFKKSIKIPSGTDAKHISAKFKNGILRITAQKPVSGKNIPIK